MEKDIDLNAEEDRTIYSGTFRWKIAKKLPSLPSLIFEMEQIEEYLSLQQGWKSYFLTRGELSQLTSLPATASPLPSPLPNSSNNNKPLKLIDIALQDLCLVDCLSFPLSIAYVIIEKNLFNLSPPFPSSSEASSSAARRREKEQELVRHPPFASSDRIVYEELTILCIGCSYKTEERILKETNSFQELQYLLLPYFQKLTIWLIGPEISQTIENYEIIEQIHRQEDDEDDPSSEEAGKGKKHILTFHLYKGTTANFIKQRPHLLHQTSSTVVIGYNCGFGNFDNNYSEDNDLQEKNNKKQKQKEKSIEELILLKYHLLFDWIYDLSILTQLLQKVPCIFFCANDYSDLSGEIHILLHIFGMELICEPAENPFSMASTMVGENPQENDYSRGNSFYYAFQGINPQRRIKLQSLKEFYGLHSQNIPIANNPHAIALLKELIPYLQQIQHYSQGLNYLKEGKLALKRVPIVSKGKEKNEPSSSNNDGSKEELPVMQPPHHLPCLPSASDSENISSFNTAEVIPLIEKVDEVFEVVEKITDVSLPETPLQTTSPAIVSSEPEGEREEEQVKDPSIIDIQQSRKDTETEKMIVLKITSHVIDMKTIDLSIHRNGKEMLLKYHLLAHPSTKQTEEKSFPLTTIDEPIDTSIAKIQAKLNSKKKLLTVTISY